MSVLGRCPSSAESKKMNEERRGQTLRILGRCPSYRESKKTTKEWQKPTLGVRFREVCVLKRVKKK